MKKSSPRPAAPEIFLSYAWGQPQEAIVDLLYHSLRAKGFRIVREKVELGYRGGIRQFMQRIGAGRAVIVVISDRYLKSKNGMFEALEVARNGQLAERIFPIVLADADIFDPVVRLGYIKFWEDKIAALNATIKGLVDLSYIASATAELNHYADVKRFIDEFMSVVADMNVLTPERHQGSDFGDLAASLDALFAADAMGG